jgi:hypothetical protein
MLEELEGKDVYIGLYGGGRGALLAEQPEAIQASAGAIDLQEYSMLCNERDGFKTISSSYSKAVTLSKVPFLSPVSLATASTRWPQAGQMTWARS